MRKATVRDREIECLRWRCRNTQLPEAHLDLFLSHGMVASAKCHTLETKTMTTAERKALKEAIAEEVEKQDTFLEKYLALWNKMKSCMAWDRPKIYVEETNDAKLGRDAVDVTNTYLRKMLHRVFKADSGKKYRTAATVQTFLQRCAKTFCRFEKMLWILGDWRVFTSIFRRGCG